MVHKLSCSVACRILLDQGSKPVPCIGRQILNHCATREAPIVLFLTTEEMILFYFMLSEILIKQEF